MYVIYYSYIIEWKITTNMHVTCNLLGDKKDEKRSKLLILTQFMTYYRFSDFH